VISLKKMRRWLTHLTILLAMCTMAANTLCLAECIAASCEPAPQTSSTEENHSCHKDGDSTEPGDSDQACAYAQAFVADPLRTSVSGPGDEISRAIAPPLVTVGVALISSPSVNLFEDLPPLIPDIVSTTILRV
jgi:hypothetical protein